MPDRDELEKLSKEKLIELLEDGAKNWLAHDGLWFQAVEQMSGMDAAIHCDTEAWRRFSPIEAKRILKRHGIPENGGLDALEKALTFRLYARINEQKITRVDAHRLTFEMSVCRVQEARARKKLPDFPCKSVGTVEYEEFAKAVDPRIRTRCVACPPDAHPAEFHCKWEFTLPA